MSDLHNAAVLLMTLPEDEAGALMAKLDPKQVEQVSTEIARIRVIPADEQERVIKQFADSNPALGGLGGGLELAKILIEKALGTGAAAVLNSSATTLAIAATLIALLLIDAPSRPRLVALSIQRSWRKEQPPRDLVRRGRIKSVTTITMAVPD